jgi:GntR family transcriptional repressor for pyruvate dehydrogenase complex
MNSDQSDVEGPIRAPRQKLADQVAVLLEDRILSGDLEPGSRLPVEFELADELSVSRTVVRDALRSLAVRGLITVRQGSGTVVTSPSPSGYAEALAMFLMRSDTTIGDLWIARQELESALALAAIRRGETDWTALETALDDYRRAVDAGRWRDAEDAHGRFHLGLLTALNNPLVDILLGPMQQVILMSARTPWFAADPTQWASDITLHEPILAALVARDEKSFMEAMDDHYYFIHDTRHLDFRKERLRESPVARANLRRWQTR